MGTYLTKLKFYFNFYQNLLIPKNVNLNILSNRANFNTLKHEKLFANNYKNQYIITTYFK